MIQVKKIRKAEIAVALVKRAAAILVCGAKNRRKGNLLLYRHCCCLSAVLRKELDAKDAAPSNGAVSFSISTKNERFHHKHFSKDRAFYGQSILMNPFCF